MKHTIVLFLCLSNILLMHALTPSIMSGDWDDPNIWSTGVVPPINEIAKIESGHIVNIPANYTAEIKYVIVASGAQLNVLLDGSLHTGTNFTSLSGIINDGTVRNEGIINIEVMGDGGVLGDGIRNNGHFLNKVAGSIIITGENKNGQDGIWNSCSGTDKFWNKGFLSISKCYNGIMNSTGVFTNFRYGNIEIEDCWTGIINFATLFNSGHINIIDIESWAIVNNDFFRNAFIGTIDIEGGFESRISESAIFRNYGIFDLHDSPLNGMKLNKGSFINQAAGRLDVRNSQYILFKNYAFTEFINYGIASFYDNGTFFCYGTLINEACGSLYTNDDFYNNSLSNTMYNKGWMIQENVFGLDDILNFQNDGVLSYKGDLSTLPNEAIVIENKIGFPEENVPIADALVLGDLDDHTVVGWYTAEDGTVIAGSYDATVNEFTPNADGDGMLSLWVRITDDSENCTEDFEVIFDQPVVGDFEPLKKATYNNTAVSIQQGQQVFSEVMMQQAIEQAIIMTYTGQVLYRTDDLQDAKSKLNNLDNGAYLMQVKYQDGVIETYKLPVTRN